MAVGVMFLQENQQLVYTNPSPTEVGPGSPTIADSRLLHTRVSYSRHLLTYGSTNKYSPVSHLAVTSVLPNGKRLQMVKPLDLAAANFTTAD
jgi:hypothetical protein